MSGNTFGQLLRLTTFGESHGIAIGGILDGFPAGIVIDMEAIDKEIRRRRPGQSDLVSQRNEKDKVNFLSGFSNCISLGTPIAFLVWNEDTKPEDYEQLSHSWRPSHADFTFEQKFGIREVSGGGRSSARETVARVISGAIVRQMLNLAGIKISAYVSNIGGIILEKSYRELNLETTESSAVRCPDKETSAKMVELIRQTSSEGDTLGGRIDCVISGVEPGLGEPVFDKLHADLGKAMLSINAVKGFEFGSGFQSSLMKGSQHNDLFTKKDNKISTLTNYSGGIQGGISNGNDIYFSVAFKPVSTLMKNQETIDREGNKIILSGKGRHDVCVVPRAVPIVESMAALVVADHYLRNKTSRF